MRTLKSIYPDYEGRVTILGVEQDPTEGASKIREFAGKNGYTWEMATFDADIVLEYRILQQSSKVAINANGVITYRGGYGNLSPSKWREVLDEVAG